MRSEVDVSKWLKESIKGEQYRNLFISGDHKVLTATVRQKITKVLGEK